MDDSTLRCVQAAIKLHVAESQSRINQQIESGVSELAAAGRLIFGAMANVVTPQVSANCALLLDQLVASVSALSRETDAYVLLKAAMESYLDFARQKVASSISGFLGATPASTLIEAGEEMFGREEQRLRVRLRTKAFAFAEVSQQEEGATQRVRGKATKPLAKSEKNKPGGRPRAEFWDDLLIAIFARIYAGDLMPTTQADLMRAMQEWADAREIDVSDTSLKARARKLFDSLHRDDH